MLKKTVILVFIVCMILQAGFIAMHTVTRIRSHKAAIKSMLKKDLKNGKFNAVLVTFTEEQLKHAEWEHSKEFFLGEDKFDVVKISDSAGIKIYHCINDKKEKELYKSLDTHKKKNNLFEDVIKKFCMNTPAHPSNQLPLIHAPVLHREHGPDHYIFSFTADLFRPPTYTV